ncbi:primosomal protein N' [Amnibacterium kyonggiense]|uniref:Replication restart DNA helicase PriA n=1 Tax=Amnibacterium kyonggiense TaxID=595671 RepID=A0A4R7FLY9_9MICO|nr:primosomal protein N' [Amnibacterium kyonggiense]TDS77441.1 replication restart DNA helicase PriA [Amnibacterium kyonggiense]
MDPAPPAPDAPARERIAKVVLDSPLPRLDHLFDYRIPAALADEAVPGVRVKVPLRVAGRVADGWIVAVADTSDAPGELSRIDRVVSSAPVLAPEVWRLARAVADRNAGVASDVLRIAVPKRQARVEQRWVAAEREPAAPIEAEPDPIAEALVAGRRIAALPTAHVVEVGGEWVGGWAADIAVTAAAVAAAGRSTIVAVPDRRDLDQLEAALEAGPAAALVLRVDASRPPAARARAHLAALEPGPHVIIGNRSAVYAPAAELGAIVVWEEADPFHQEPLAPYAGTRDVALLRQEQSGAGLVLLSSSRSSTVQRLVELNWMEEWGAPRGRPDVVLTPDDGRGARIPSAAYQAVQRALTAGPVLIQVARPGDAALRALRAGDAPVPIDAGRTAHELGRAFAGVPVIVADGDHVRDTVPPGPKLVVATRGAEPRAPGGYRAVLLLDGARMLLRESLWVAEDCLRWWSGAATLAAPDAPVHLVGVTGDVATALATWRSADFAARQLVDRRVLRFPPTVRLAAATGPLKAVEELVDAWAAVGADVLSRTSEERGERVVVRFSTGAGRRVAEVAKEALIRHGSARRPKPPAPPPPVLRVRFDPHEPF